jgi:1-deoxy-D-xylulose-5-phosphate reductoisomerase
MPIDWNTSHTWSFAPIDSKRFPAVALGQSCGEIGGGLPAIFNASNEVAVQAFIDGQISFTSIVEVVSDSVEALRSTGVNSLRNLSDVSAIEEDARRIAREKIEKVTL